MLYDRKKEYMVPIVERKAGFSFARTAVPQPADIVKASAVTVSNVVCGVSDRCGCFGLGVHAVI